MRLRLKIPIIVVVVLVFGYGVLSFFGFFVLAELEAEQHGFQILPSILANMYTVQINNDRPETVSISRPGDDDMTKLVKAGETIVDDRYSGRTEEYTINDQTGNLIGCLHISLDQSHPSGKLLTDRRVVLNTSKTEFCHE